MNNGTDDKSNVIDISDRVTSPDITERFRNLKVRLDLEHAKVMISTSLLSVVLIVTLANNSLMTRVSAPDEAQVSRGIASIAGTTDEAELAHMEKMGREFAQKLSKSDLSADASVGRKPSALESLRFGLLEGKYAVRLHENGKLSEIEFSDAAGSADSPKHINDVAQFLDSHRDLMPVDFDKTLKVSSTHIEAGTLETYQLVNSVSIPLAKVLFKTDSAGRMIAMRIAPLQIAAK